VAGKVPRIILWIAVVAGHAVRAVEVIDIFNWEAAGTGHRFFYHVGFAGDDDFGLSVGNSLAKIM
jgi:hypothetical protein